MAASRLPPATLTLKQFMRRQQVLLLYRRILRAIRQVPNDSDRRYLKDWAREEFKRNKSATEEALPTTEAQDLTETKASLQKASVQH
ncbi:LYR motif-containing protein 2 isoform X2 [Castor canadensis]|uniref:LYR motif-containing protein 2 isoform X2 n=1 Tax=Castor canadensis TaxID=51338 RepID=A0AC58MY27_CASCN